MADFCRSDTEGQGSKGSVRGGMTVATNDCLPRLCDAQFRADDVNDALQIAVEAIEADTEFLAVRLQLRYLVVSSRSCVGDSTRVVVGIE